MATKLYVGNLSFDTTENDIQDLFAGAGTVRETVLMQDRMTGKSRGFAFVTMTSEEEAQNAARQLQPGRLTSLVTQSSTPFNENAPAKTGAFLFSFFAL